MPIFLRVEGHFDAAHKLVNYEGKCARMHGHRWQVKVEFGPFSEEDPDEAGLTIDFKILRASVNDVCELYDHRCLNDFFDAPSAEIVAMRILYLIESSTNVHVHSAELFESPESRCRVTH